MQFFFNFYFWGCGPQKNNTPKSTFYHISVNICTRKSWHTSIKAFWNYFSIRINILAKILILGFLNPKIFIKKKFKANIKKFFTMIQIVKIPFFRGISRHPTTNIYRFMITSWFWDDSYLGPTSPKSKLYKIDKNYKPPNMLL